MAAFDKVLREQSTSNRNVDRWEDAYAEHRARLTSELAELAVRASCESPRLCLLGAGNCRDVDLRRLSELYAEIHLVDIDRRALVRACERHEPGVRERLRSHAPVDLTGVFDQMETWRKSRPTLRALDDVVPRAVQRITDALPGPFDVVASCCLVTQMSRSVSNVIGRDDPMRDDIWERVATIHLRSLAALLAPGGHALFASDVVSNSTYPLDDLPDDADLAALIPELVRTNNFFTGGDPARLSWILRRDPVLKLEAGPANLLTPWLWNAGADVVFLVNAFHFQRNAGGPGT